jgi:hypothetical protein
MAFLIESSLFVITIIFENTVGGFTEGNDIMASEAAVIAAKS